MNNGLAAKDPELKKRVIELKRALFWGNCQEETEVSPPAGVYEKFEIIDGDQEFPDGSEILSADPYKKKIFVRTRSILQILVLYSKFIRVPPEHLAKTEPRDQQDGAKTMSSEERKAVQDRKDYQDMVERQLKNNLKNLSIKMDIWSDKLRPEDAFVSIKYNGYWFYIDDNDYRSKDTFSSLAGILCMSETGTPKEQTPLLTLPVQ